jgi:allantoicase
MEGRRVTTTEGGPGELPAPGGFSAAIDLAARRLGGMVLDATDEFFAPKENLLAPEEPVFDAAAYGDRGKIMDGWESRRRRDDGEDTCTVRLGVAGVLSEVVVDTTHFRGNAPASCWLQGCVSDGAPDAATAWFPLLDPTPLLPHERQLLPVDRPIRVTHVRFGIVPDGGVARLRLLGRPLVDLHAAADPSGRVDLAAAVNGGRAVGCSDQFYSSPHNLLMVGDARTMADGWETRRRRGPGEDWAIIELATTGRIDRVELDTTNFKGNHPDRCVVEGTYAPGTAPGTSPATQWRELVAATSMQPHLRHAYAVTDPGPVSHLRLRVLPDGGVARLRAFGTVDEDGWRRHGLAHLDTMDDTSAQAALLACCGSTEWARQVAARRPFGDEQTLMDVADEVWADLTTQDHLEAFAAHPRIGQRSGGRWSGQEQAGTASAEERTLAALAEGNRRYEDRFDHVFLICATGLSAEELLTSLTERIDNDPATELAIAAEEQRRITRLRLEKLLRDGRSG